MEQKYTEEGLPIMPTSAVAVAAAMVAVVADSPVGYVSTSSGLRNRNYDRDMHAPVYSTGCIQGAVLEKLGYYKLPESSLVNNGDYDTMMQVLGQVDDPFSDMNPEQERLRNALSVAQSANDSRLPWSAALEGFERVMAGEDVRAVRSLVAQARNSLTRLKNPERLLTDQCVCGCGATVKAATSTTVNPFMPSWIAESFAKSAEVEMASMKKFIALANEPVGPIELNYFSFPVVQKPVPESAFMDLSTV